MKNIMVVEPSILFMIKDIYRYRLASEDNKLYRDGTCNLFVQV